MLYSTVYVINWSPHSFDISDMSLYIPLNVYCWKAPCGQYPQQDSNLHLLVKPNALPIELCGFSLFISLCIQWYIQRNRYQYIHSIHHNVYHCIFNCLVLGNNISLDIPLNVYGWKAPQQDSNLHLLVKPNALPIELCGFCLFISLCI